MSLKTNENQQKKKSSSALAYGGAIIASLGILVFLTLLMTNAFSGTGSNGSKVLLAGNSKVINLQVQIPCSGHTGLIISELNKLIGIIDVKSVAWNKFQVTFDSTKTSEKQILGAQIFKQYSVVVN